MSKCIAEWCAYWTGFGCACEVMDVEPVDMSKAEEC